jgi:hypothetical protein
MCLKKDNPNVLNEAMTDISFSVAGRKSGPIIRHHNDVDAAPESREVPAPVPRP